MQKILAILFSGMAAITLASCGLFSDQATDQVTGNSTFEIYLLPLEVFWEETDESIACAGEEGPLLSIKDLQSYDTETHELRLNQSAFERLSQVELAGQPFVVCVNQMPIYAGEFMALFISRSSDRVVILWPPMEEDEPVMQIQLGYPGPDFYTGEDPRSDARILRALEQSGLIDENQEK